MILKILIWPERVKKARENRNTLILNANHINPAHVSVFYRQATYLVRKYRIKVKNSAMGEAVFFGIQENKTKEQKIFRKQN